MMMHTTSMMLVSRSPTRTTSESDSLLTGRISRLYLLFFSMSSYRRLASKPSRTGTPPDDVISRPYHVTAATALQHPGIATVDDERPTPGNQLVPYSTLARALSTVVSTVR